MDFMAQEVRTLVLSNSDEKFHDLNCTNRNCFSLKLVEILQFKVRIFNLTPGRVDREE